MSEAFHSAAWYRVGSLVPRLAVRAQVHRHRYRGEAWYVLQDHASGRTHRFTPATYLLLGLMDGQRTVDQIWQTAVERLEDQAPGQDEMIRLLGQLHGADLLECEVTPDTEELFRRHSRQATGNWLRNVRNPFSVRIPLWDPDRFLERAIHSMRWLFGSAGVLLWLAMAGAGLVLAGIHWDELTQNFSDRVLSGHNLAVAFLVFPFVKLLHELGHAFATKASGGEVHDIGILLLVFMPVPYVDASASSAFRSKTSRAVVGAAGMLVETFLAAAAMIVWVLVEPGVARAIAFNVMVIAGFSTVIFNGNPLLRYDGYYILCDLIEMPNLAARSQQYWLNLVERRLFGMDHVEPPVLADGERIWLATFAVAAFAYRTLVTIGIILFIAGEFYFIGVVFALWGAVAMILAPVWKALRYLMSNPRLAHRRRRAIALSAGTFAAALAFVMFVPVPLRTSAEGVVWLPEDAQVRAGTDGFVRRVIVAPGRNVEAGRALIESEDPVLAARIGVLEAKVAELQAKYTAEMFSDRVQAEVTREELSSATQTLARENERSGQLVARAGSAGIFVLPQVEDLPGRFARKGQVLGYVVEPSATLVRAIVGQDDIELVRDHLKRVEVRLSDQLADIITVRLAREVPAAKDQLPSAALTTEGGGTLPSDPRDQKGVKSIASVFQFDLELPPEAQQFHFGTRAYVRFEHSPEPLASQWYRRVRQLFLARFNV
jgi:putative peptide zinc metalloprotease protein